MEVGQAETQGEGTERRARDAYYTYPELVWDHPTMTENELRSLWQRRLRAAPHTIMIDGLVAIPRPQQNFVDRVSSHMNTTSVSQRTQVSDADGVQAALEAADVARNKFAKRADTRLPKHAEEIPDAVREMDTDAYDETERLAQATHGANAFGDRLRGELQKAAAWQKEIDDEDVADFRVEQEKKKEAVKAKAKEGAATSNFADPCTMSAAVSNYEASYLEKCAKIDAVAIRLKEESQLPENKEPEDEAEHEQFKKDMEERLKNVQDALAAFVVKTTEFKTQQSKKVLEGITDPKIVKEKTKDMQDESAKFHKEHASAFRVEAKKLKAFCASSIKDFARKEKAAAAAAATKRKLSDISSPSTEEQHVLTRDLRTLQNRPDTKFEQFGTSDQIEDYPATAFFSDKFKDKFQGVHRMLWKIYRIGNSSLNHPRIHPHPHTHRWTVGPWPSAGLCLVRRGFA